MSEALPVIDIPVASSGSGGIAPVSGASPSPSPSPNSPPPGSAASPDPPSPANFQQLFAQLQGAPLIAAGPGAHDVSPAGKPPPQPGSPLPPADPAQTPTPAGLPTLPQPAVMPPPPPASTAQAPLVQPWKPTPDAAAPPTPDAAAPPATPGEPGTVAGPVAVSAVPAPGAPGSEILPSAVVVPATPPATGLRPMAAPPVSVAGAPSPANTPMAPYNGTAAAPVAIPPGAEVAAGKLPDGFAQIYPHSDYAISGEPAASFTVARELGRQMRSPTASVTGSPAAAIPPGAGIAPASSGLGPNPANTVLIVDTPPAQPGFEAELNNRILWMTRHNLQSAEIRLNPPHLGPLEVQITVSKGEAHVLFTSAHAVVREALEAAIPRLREGFNEQGLVLGEADVADAFDRQSGEAGFSPPGDRWHAATELSAEDSQLETAVAVHRGDGLLDVYA